MAGSKLPNPLERRHLIEGALDPSRARQLAEAYLAEGRGLEAVPFLHRAGARERLAALRAEAVETGDAFLLREIAQVTGEQPGRADWRALSEAAAAAGKQRYAALAQREAEREKE